MAAPEQPTIAVVVESKRVTVKTCKPFCGAGLRQRIDRQLERHQASELWRLQHAVH
jgi:hypothetical protein